VKDNWLRLNPELRPMIGFGPDVAGSLWFAEQCHAAGISAAHIDSERIWINGEVLSSDDPENRKHLARLSERGSQDRLQSVRDAGRHRLAVALSRDHGNGIRQRHELPAGRRAGCSAPTRIPRSRSACRITAATITGTAR
jgi:hypothetical protein